MISPSAATNMSLQSVQVLLLNVQTITSVILIDQANTIILFQDKKFKSECINKNISIEKNLKLCYSSTKQ